MGRFIRAVLFDLGNTLMHGVEPWQPVEAQADQALVESLRRDGFALPDGFASQFRQRLSRYYREREQNLFETTYFSVLRELLNEQGYGTLQAPLIRSALDALYSVTQSNWTLDEDALLTLRVLESGGYRLGLVSNAGDDQDVRTLARNFGIDRFFDFILTSAGCSYRKPHPRIFEVALMHWGFPAVETAMVGDTLEADVLGANRVGMFSIWYTAHVSKMPAASDIQPGAVVGSLLQIPDLLVRMS
jgi:HAD superfamily hydrolase (TIGR01549 family)